MAHSPASPSPRGVVGNDATTRMSEQHRGASTMSVEARCSCGALHQVPILTEKAEDDAVMVSALKNELRDAQHEVHHLNEYALQLEWQVRQRETDVVAANQERILAGRDLKVVTEKNQQLLAQMERLALENKELRIQEEESSRASVETHAHLQSQISKLEALLREAHRALEASQNEVLQLREAAAAASKAAVAARSTATADHVEGPRSARATPVPQAAPLVFRPATTANATKQKSAAAAPRPDSNAGHRDADQQSNVEALTQFTRHITKENAMLQKLLLEKEALIAELRVASSSILVTPALHSQTRKHTSTTTTTSYNVAETSAAPLPPTFTGVAAAGPVGGPTRRTVSPRSTAPHDPPPMPLHDTSASWAIHARGIHQDPATTLRTMQSVKETARVLYEVVRQLRNMLAGQLPLVDMQTNGHPIACEMWHAANGVLSRVGASLEHPMPDAFHNIADAQRWFPRCIPGVEGSCGAGAPGGPGRYASSSSRSPSASHVQSTAGPRHVTEEEGLHPSVVQHARVFPPSRSSVDELPSHHSNNPTIAASQPVDTMALLEEEIRALQAERKQFEKENTVMTMQLYSGGMVVKKKVYAHPQHATSRSVSRQSGRSFK